MTLTATYLARLIADAVLGNAGARDPDGEKDAPTQAVLHVLRCTGTGFYQGRAREAHTPLHDAPHSDRLAEKRR